MSLHMTHNVDNCMHKPAYLMILPIFRIQKSLSMTEPTLVVCHTLHVHIYFHVYTIARKYVFFMCDLHALLSDVTALKPI